MVSKVSEIVSPYLTIHSHPLRPTIQHQQPSYIFLDTDMLLSFFPKHVVKLLVRVLYIVTFLGFLDFEQIENVNTEKPDNLMA